MNIVINAVITLFTMLNHHRHHHYQHNVELFQTDTWWYTILVWNSLPVSAHGMQWTACFYRATSYANVVLAPAILSVCLFARPSVCLSVCLSVARVLCDKTKQRVADILIPHERAITLLFWHQRWLVGDAPYRLTFALKVIHSPSKNADFDRFLLIMSQP